MLPKDIAKLVPKTHLMSESEWRNLGVQQSQGWVHYMIHEPGESRMAALRDASSHPTAQPDVVLRPHRATHPPLPTAAAQEAREVSVPWAGRSLHLPGLQSTFIITIILLLLLLSRTLCSWELSRLGQSHWVPKMLMNSVPSGHLQQLSSGHRAVGTGFSKASIKGYLGTAVCCCSAFGGRGREVGGRKSSRCSGTALLPPGGSGVAVTGEVLEGFIGREGSGITGRGRGEGKRTCAGRVHGAMGEGGAVGPPPAVALSALNQSELAESRDVRFSRPIGARGGGGVAEPVRFGGVHAGGAAGCGGSARYRAAERGLQSHGRAQLRLHRRDHHYRG